MLLSLTRSLLVLAACLLTLLVTMPVARAQDATAIDRTNQEINLRFSEPDLRINKADYIPANYLVAVYINRSCPAAPDPVDINGNLFHPWKRSLADVRYSSDDYVLTPGDTYYVGVYHRVDRNSWVLEPDSCQPRQVVEHQVDQVYKPVISWAPDKKLYFLDLDIQIPQVQPGYVRIRDLAEATAKQCPKKLDAAVSPLGISGKATSDTLYGAGRWFVAVYKTVTKSVSDPNQRGVSTPKTTYELVSGSCQFYEVVGFDGKGTYAPKLPDNVLFTATAPVASAAPALQVHPFGAVTLPIPVVTISANGNRLGWASSGLQFDLLQLQYSQQIYVALAGALINEDKAAGTIVPDVYVGFGPVLHHDLGKSWEYRINPLIMAGFGPTVFNCEEGSDLNMLCGSNHNQFTQVQMMPWYGPGLRAGVGQHTGERYGWNVGVFGALEMRYTNGASLPTTLYTKAGEVEATFQTPVGFQLVGRVGPYVTLRWW